MPIKKSEEAALCVTTTRLKLVTYGSRLMERHTMSL